MGQSDRSLLLGGDVDLVAAECENTSRWLGSMVLWEAIVTRGTLLVVGQEEPSSSNGVLYRSWHESSPELVVLTPVHETKGPRHVETKVN